MWIAFHKWNVHLFVNEEELDELLQMHWLSIKSLGYQGN